MNKWKLTVRALIKEYDKEELTEEEQELISDAKCYLYMFPILCKKAEKRIKRRDKWKIINEKRRMKEEKILSSMK